MTLEQLKTKFREWDRRFHEMNQRLDVEEDSMDTWLFRFYVILIGVAIAFALYPLHP